MEFPQYNANNGCSSTTGFQLYYHYPNSFTNFPSSYGNQMGANSQALAQYMCTNGGYPYYNPYNLNVGMANLTNYKEGQDGDS